MQKQQNKADQDSMHTLQDNLYYESWDLTAHSTTHFSYLSDNAFNSQLH